MSPRNERRHIGHYEIPGGTAHITWRLHRAQLPMAGCERSNVLEVLRRDDGARCRIHACVIMDDHIHVLAGFTFGVAAAKIVHGWKSISAHLLCKQGRTSPLWQAEYYQRWLASPRLIPICTSYILANPARKWPGTGDYPWVIPPC